MGIAKFMYFRVFKSFLLKFLFPLVYRVNCLKKLKQDKVILIEVRMRPLSNNYTLIYEKLVKERHMDVHISYLENTKGSRLSRVFRDLRLIKDMADAKYIFIDDSSQSVGAVKLRKDSRLIQIWHACGAFKKFGLSTADLGFGQNRFDQEHYPSHGGYSLVPVSSRDVVWAYEDAFGFSEGSGVVQPLGTSRTDSYFDPVNINRAERRVREFFPQSAGKKIILYAPTFRGEIGQAKTPDCLDIGRLRAEFSSDYVLLIRHHYLAKDVPEIPEEYRDFAADVSRNLTIEECLMTAEVCISDYSSLIFEYSLMERPMLFFAFDMEEYDDWRGFYYPYEEFTPGPVCRDNDELIRRIRELKDGFDRERVRAFREKFMGACDGHATERILEKIMDHRAE